MLTSGVESGGEKIFYVCEPGKARDIRKQQEGKNVREIMKTDLLVADGFLLLEFQQTVKIL